MEREKWLEERRTGIGGSDAAAVMGLSKYSTPWTVWADKTGRVALEKEDNEAMLQGRDLEPYVVKRFTDETKLIARRVNRAVRNAKYPFAFANIDRKIKGMRAGLECKTCSPYRLREFENGRFPQEYYVQCLHYLAVTGYEAWYLAVLIFGTDFKVFRIEPNELEIEQLMCNEKAFWNNYVLSNTPPPPDGLDATRRAISSVYNSAVDGAADLSYMEETFVDLAALNNEKKILSQQIEQRKQEIMVAMGENIRAECSAWIANWKPRKDGIRVFSVKEK